MNGGVSQTLPPSIFCLGLLDVVEALDGKEDPRNFEPWKDGGRALRELTRLE